jgi:hypothetical protein
MIVILITAGRNIRDGSPIERVLRRYIDLFGASNITLRHGDAKGGDNYGKFIARKLKVAAIESFPIDDEAWQIHGLSAGNIRNEEMLDTDPVPDIVIAFPDDNSKGTYNCIDQALKRDIPVEMYCDYLSLDNRNRTKYENITQR